MEGGIWAQSLRPPPHPGWGQHRKWSYGALYRETDIHHTGQLEAVARGGGELLPEEAGAGLLQSPIKLLVPQGGGWEREDAAYSTLQSLHTGLWTAHGHVKTKDTATMEPY